MKKEYFKTPSASHVYLMRRFDGKVQVLLQLRQNNWKAGYWDASAAGHVDEDECMTSCMIREAREEIGVEIDNKDVDFIVTMHSNFKGEGGAIYYDVFFFVEKWKGEPRISEPDKIAELKWFDVDGLPENILQDRKKAIQNYRDGIHYSEYGWDK